MPVAALYAKPNEDFVGLGTTTVSQTANDTAYPASNVQNNNPGDVAKSTATSTVYTITGAAPVTIEGFCIFNHNLEGATVTLTNGVGYSQVIAIPARRSSGAVVNAWLDCRGHANPTDDVWTLTITGAAANIQIGRLYLVSTWYELPHQWDIAWEDERILVDPYETFYRHKVPYDTLTNQRRAKGKVVSAAAFDDLYDLYHAAKGRVTPWVMIPDYSVNDALYVQFTTPALQWRKQAPNYTPVELQIEEASAGPPP